jgi:hypothetical protein
MIRFKIVVVLVMTLPVGVVLAKSTRDDTAQGRPIRVKQIKVGNFALPNSQQPGPLFSFGQNILEKGDLELYAYVDYFKGHRKHQLDVIPAILYGISDKASIFGVLPICASQKFNDTRLHSLQDLYVQFEYVLYDHNTKTTADQVTVVANVSFPTGSALKTPYTSFGSPGFFLGFTASHTLPSWYVFVSSGALVATSHEGTKIGNQFFYQAGISGNIRYCPDKWILSCFLELDGVYRQRNRVAGAIDCNSGGNEILLGPSLWFSTQRFLIHGGIQGYIAQHLFGVQTKNNYFAAVNVGWKC